MLAAFLGLVLAARAAGGERLVLDVELDGRPAGTRTVETRLLPPDDIVRVPARLVEVTDEVDGSLSGRAVRRRARGLARATATGSSFSVSVEDERGLREIQGRMRPDGSWLVVEVAGGERRAATWRPSEVDLTSLDLLDPERHERLENARRAAVLLVGEGVVVAGPVEDLGEAELRVGGRPVRVHRVAWSPPGSRVVFAWTEDGVLVDVDAELPGGGRLRLHARELPAPASWGGVRLGRDVPLEEEEL